LTEGGAVDGFALIVVFWLMQAALTGWLADERGRGAGPWTVTGLIFGPLALLAVGLAPLGTAGLLKACVECQMGVPALATRCPHCRTDLMREEADDFIGPMSEA
jgi:hypothetical protein